MKLDFSQVPSFARSKQDYSLFAFDGCPMPHVFSPGKGMFFSPANNLGAESLKMQILEWRWIRESRHGYPSQLYLDVLFVNEDNAISILSLNREPAKHFSTLLKQFSDTEGDIYPYAIEVMLSCSGRTFEVNGEEKCYSIPDRFDWKWVEQSRFADAATWLAEFRPENPWLMAGVEDAPSI